MKITPAKKGTGLQGLIDSLTPGAIEEVKKVSPVHATKFGPLLAKFKVYLDNEIPFWPADVGAYAQEEGEEEGEEGEEEYLPDMVRDVLTPVELEAFFQLTIRHEENPEFYEKAGFFLDKLIGNGYQAGYNSFKLTTATLPKPLSVGNDLHGTNERPLSLTVKGNVKSSFGCGSSNTRYILQGDFCEEDYCAYSAENCNFSFYGAIQSDDVGRDAKYCVFKALREEAVETLLQQVPPGNKIIQLLPNKRQKVLRDYDE